jgi:hypothetical protein
MRFEPACDKIHGLILTVVCGFDTPFANTAQGYSTTNLHKSKTGG